MDDIKQIDLEKVKVHRSDSSTRGARKMSYSTGIVHRDFAGLTGISLEGSESEDSKINQKYKRKPFDYSKLEMSKSGDKIIYGMDEIGPIYGLYGRDSEIYNAMAEGKVVSGMIEESMKKNQEVGNDEIAQREASLLARCLKREKEKGIGV